jgi:hypothetical protein
MQVLVVNIQRMNVFGRPADAAGADSGQHRF